MIIIMQNIYCIFYKKKYPIPSAFVIVVMLENISFDILWKDL